jgi:hypothetical protein
MTQRKSRKYAKNTLEYYQIHYNAYVYTALNMVTFKPSGNHVYHLL